MDSNRAASNPADSKELQGTGQKETLFFFFMFSLFKIFILFNYFSLRWVFIAMHKIFSSCSCQGLLSRCSVRASHCSGFSCC